MPECVKSAEHTNANRRNPECCEEKVKSRGEETYYEAQQCACPVRCDGSLSLEWDLLRKAKLQFEVDENLNHKERGVKPTKGPPWKESKQEEDYHIESSPPDPRDNMHPSFPSELFSLNRTQIAV